MAKNYTEEETVRIINAYKESPSRETVDELAEELGKTVKSVIGKLSREKVYVKVAYKTKRGERPETKLQMTEHIAGMLQGDAVLRKVLKFSVDYPMDKFAMEVDAKRKLAGRVGNLC